MFIKEKKGVCALDAGKPSLHATCVFGEIKNAVKKYFHCIETYFNKLLNSFKNKSKNNSNNNNKEEI